MSCCDMLCMQVVADIKQLLHSTSPVAEPDTTPEGHPTWVALFSTLAWQCASTFRCDQLSSV